MSGIAEVYPIHKVQLGRFERLVSSLREGVNSTLVPSFKHDVVIRRFSLAFDCSWTTIRTYLSNEGISVYNPMEALREASKMGWLGPQEPVWVEMLSFKTEVQFLHEEKEILKACMKISDSFVIELENLLTRLKDVG